MEQPWPHVNFHFLRWPFTQFHVFVGYQVHACMGPTEFWYQCMAIICVDIERPCLAERFYHLYFHDMFHIPSILEISCDLSGVFWNCKRWSCVTQVSRKVIEKWFSGIDLDFNKTLWNHYLYHLSVFISQETSLKTAKNMVLEEMGPLWAQIKTYSCWNTVGASKSITEFSPAVPRVTGKSLISKKWHHNTDQNPELYIGWLATVEFRLSRTDVLVHSYPNNGNFIV